MSNKKKRKVPKRVLYNIEKVRNSGIVNMFDSSGVLMVLGIYDKWSSVWFDKFCFKSSGKSISKNYSIVLEQFSEYLRDKNEISNSKTG